MFRKRIASVFFLILIAACGSDEDSRPETDLPLASLPGVYSGTFPCDGCAGIPTTLWLRSDGRFFFRQSYPSDATSTVDDVYSLGRWSLSIDHDTVELRGSGPIRAFSRLDPDVLIMRTVSDREHRLTRNPEAPEFSATMRLSGTMQILGSDAEFTECLTGIEAPVSKGGDFPRFWRQVRSLGRSSGPVYVELEGSFAWADDGAPESMIIRRFVTIRTDASC